MRMKGKSVVLNVVLVIVVILIQIQLIVSFQSFPTRINFAQKEIGFSPVRQGDVLIQPTTTTTTTSTSITTNTKKIRTPPQRFLGLQLAAIPSEASPTTPNSVILKPIDIRPILRQFYRSSWFAWWAQIILTVVSSAIITFANIVRQVTTKDYSIWLSGFALSSVGVILALLSSIWTWNITTICRKIWTKKIDNKKIIPTLRRSAKISVGISLIGMFITLIAAEQIVGTLFSKILSSPAFTGFFPNAQAMGNLSNSFQPIDIFLVQANTNCLISHFVSLFVYILLQIQLPKDDQPVQLNIEKQVSAVIEDL